MTVTPSRVSVVCSAFHQGYCLPDQWPADKLVGLCLVKAQCLSTNLACQPGMHTKSIWLGLCMFTVQKTSQLYPSYINDDRNQFRLFARREWSYFQLGGDKTIIIVDIATFFINT